MKNLNFIPIVQQKVASKKLINSVLKDLELVPSKQESESIYDLIVYAHYFYGGCDWYITEFNAERNQFFGYAILNNDLESSEFGFIHLFDLTTHGRIELDFYWTNRKMRECLIDKDKEYFTEKIEYSDNQLKNNSHDEE